MDLSANERTVGGNTEPGKQWRLIARRSLKNPTRCSGNSAKSWLIMFKVGSKTASKIGGTCDVKRP